MNPRAKTIKELESYGFEFKRHGANHDIFWNPETKVAIPIKRHDFNENDAKYVLKEAQRNRR